eukprot:TRINITY_DN7469_c0_g1_i7.p2 TRINITY_DN7469_c0_g1~~TRINITY_DN7469_c0_g1_i7.p2  ORF type:complete len:105 (+),score=17.60 TRINITY_DN7469_c0_g1_i7:134-448(+)
MLPVSPCRLVRRPDEFCPEVPNRWGRELDKAVMSGAASQAVKSSLLEALERLFGPTFLLAKTLEPVEEHAGSLQKALQARLAAAAARRREAGRAKVGRLRALLG